MTRKISVITGSRSEYGLLRPILYEIKKSKKLELSLIVTGTHFSKKFGNTIHEIQSDGFKIFSKINTIPTGNLPSDMANSLGDGILKFTKLYKKLKPDINMILGDRHEIFSSALAAAYLNIPNAHIHGGERSQAGIDEYNRHAITKISNLHFAATQKSKQRILKLGENPKYVFFTGSPGIDEIFSKKISNKKFLEKKYNVDFNQPLFLILYHPVTTQIENIENELSLILTSLKLFNKPTIAIAPNSDAGHGIIFKKLCDFSKSNSFLKFFPAIPRQDYLGLLRYSSILIGNSSSGIIECSYFDISVINIGIRQNQRESGSNVFNVNNNVSEIQSKIRQILKSKKHFSKKNLYGNGKSAKKITNILETVEINKELIQKQITY